MKRFKSSAAGKQRQEAPNSIYMHKNRNSGGVVAEESAADARTARITLYHDETHPSCLKLPIVSV